MSKTSLSADAVSRACVRPSMAHGPAMKKKGPYYQYECFVIETEMVNIASPDSYNPTATFVATAIWYKICETLASCIF